MCVCDADVDAEFIYVDERGRDQLSVSYCRALTEHPVYANTVAAAPVSSTAREFSATDVYVNVATAGKIDVGKLQMNFYPNVTTAVYAGHPLTSMQNFTEIVIGEPLRRGR